MATVHINSIKWFWEIGSMIRGSSFRRSTVDIKKFNFW